MYIMSDKIKQYKLSSQKKKGVEVTLRNPFTPRIQRIKGVSENQLQAPHTLKTSFTLFPWRPHKAKRNQLPKFHPFPTNLPGQPNSKSLTNIGSIHETKNKVIPNITNCKPFYSESEYNLCTPYPSYKGNTN